MTTDKVIIYYTNNALEGTLIHDWCLYYLQQSSLDIITVSHKPIPVGTNLLYEGPSCGLSLLKQVVMGLDYAFSLKKYKYAFLAEHDCFYHPAHYNIEPSGIMYDDNYWRLTPNGYVHKSKLLSACCGPLSLLRAAMQDKLKVFKQRQQQLNLHEVQDAPIIYEPGFDDSYSYSLYRAEMPSIDVRHYWNFSGKGYRRKVKGIIYLPFWGYYHILRQQLNLSSKQPGLQGQDYLPAGFVFDLKGAL